MAKRLSIQEIDDDDANSPCSDYIIREEDAYLRLSDLTDIQTDVLSSCPGADIEPSCMSMGTGRLHKVIEENNSVADECVVTDSLSVAQSRELLQIHVDDLSNPEGDDEKEEPPRRDQHRKNVQLHKLRTNVRAEQRKQRFAYQVVDMDESNGSEPRSCDTGCKNDTEEAQKPLQLQVMDPTEIDKAALTEDAAKRRSTKSEFSSTLRAVDESDEDNIQAESFEDETYFSALPLLDEGLSHLSMAMLALLYRKLREMSLLGHVSVKLRDIDVNSYQAISRQKESLRRGLMTEEEKRKGLLDRTRTASFIIRAVLDECQMFKESTDLLHLNPIDRVTASYDAR